jgi:hypothetical protein
VNLSKSDAWGNAPADGSWALLQAPTAIEELGDLKIRIAGVIRRVC